MMAVGKDSSGDWMFPQRSACSSLCHTGRALPINAVCVFDAGSQELADTEYPQLDAVITFFSDKHPSLRTTADPGKPLALPHRSFEALVSLPAPCTPACQLGWLMSEGSALVRIECTTTILTDGLACR